MQEILKPASQEYEKAMSDSSSENIPKRLPIGAEILSDGAVHFRVWAPRSQRVEVIIGGGACTEAVIELNGERNGYFSARSPLAKPGIFIAIAWIGSRTWCRTPHRDFSPKVRWDPP